MVHQIDSEDMKKKTQRNKGGGHNKITLYHFAQINRPQHT